MVNLKIKKNAENFENFFFHFCDFPKNFVCAISVLLIVLYVSYLIIIRKIQFSVSRITVAHFCALCRVVFAPKLEITLFHVKKNFPMVVFHSESEFGNLQTFFKTQEKNGSFSFRMLS